MTASEPLPRLIKYSSTIHYADGAEKELFSIIADPAFDETSTWKSHHGWATYYHLSPLRRNLLNWVSFGKGPLRILEIGAGCGAITSYLVAIPDVAVTAVEGSFDRAKIIQTRCKNASNLVIHACPVDHFVPDAPFDVVTLIGVLEYAGRYGSGNEPFADLLSKAAGWLKEDGFLVTAIENQLGCKYLSGTPEDHYGIPFEGINAYPRYNGVRTFTHASLGEMIRRAGLTSQWWYYPFPDYKLPGALFSEFVLDDPSFDWSGLIDMPPEPNENQKPAFNDRSFLSLARETGVMKHFMNSFLVFSASRPQCRFSMNNNDNVAAVKVNVKARGVPFQTITKFIKSDNRITVYKTRLKEIPYNGNEWIRHQLYDKPETYFPHTKNILELSIDALKMQDTERIAHYCRIWVELLENNSVPSTPDTIERFIAFTSRHFDRQLYDGSFKGPWLDGTFLDLMPLNILLDQSGKSRPCKAMIIDLEWVVQTAVPLQLVFDRGYNLITSKFSRYFMPGSIKIDVDTGLPAAFQEGLKQSDLFMHRNMFHCRIFETWFQHSVIQGSFDLKIDWDAVVPRIEKGLEMNATPLSIESFVERVVMLVENGKTREGIEFFEQYRHLFTSEPRLKEFEEVIEKFKRHH